MYLKTLLIIVLISVINSNGLKLDINSIIESIEQDFFSIQNQYKIIINNLNICKHNFTLLNAELNMNETLALQNNNNEMDPYNAATFKIFEMNIKILKALQAVTPSATSNSVDANTAMPEKLANLKQMLTADVRSGFESLKTQQDKNQANLLAALTQSTSNAVDINQQKEDQRISEAFENNLKEMQNLTSKLDQIQNTLQTHLQSSGN